MTLAESLKSIRKNYKMTQGDISRLLGISRSAYTYYETGKTVPSVEILRKLAAVYNTTIDNVVGVPSKGDTAIKTTGSLKVAETNTDPLIYMKKEEQALIMAYRLLSDKEKKQISEMVISKLDKTEQEKLNEE